MTRQMLMVALAHVGVLQCLAALFAFLVALGDSGFAPWMIYGAGMEWADPTVMINARVCLACPTYHKGRSRGKLTTVQRWRGCSLIDAQGRRVP